MIDVIDASPSNDGDWLRIRTNTLKRHYVHKCLFPKLVADLEARDGVVGTEPVQEFSVEFRITNFMLVGRPTEVVNIDCVKIQLLSRDIGASIVMMKSLETRHFADGTEYFKFRNSNNCVVLTRAQFFAFLRWLEETYESAEIRDINFVEEWKKKLDKRNEES